MVTNEYLQVVLELLNYWLCVFHVVLMLAVSQCPAQQLYVPEHLALQPSGTKVTQGSVFPAFTGPLVTPLAVPSVWFEAGSNPLSVFRGRVEFYAPSHDVPPADRNKHLTESSLIDSPRITKHLNRNLPRYPSCSSGLLLPDDHTFQASGTIPNINVVNVQPDTPDYLNPLYWVFRITGYQLSPGEYREWFSLYFESLLASDLSELPSFTSGFNGSGVQRAPPCQVPRAKTAGAHSKKKQGSQSGSQSGMSVDVSTGQQLSQGKNQFGLLPFSSYPGFAQAGHGADSSGGRLRPPASPGSGTAGSRPDRRQRGASSARHGAEASLHKTRRGPHSINKRTDPGRSDQARFLEIQKEVFHSGLLPWKRAYDLWIDFKKLSHSANRQERRERLKMNSILTIAVNGGAAHARGASQLLDYVEYLKAIGLTTESIATLNSYIGKWRHQTNPRLEAINEKTLFWASLLNKQLLEKRCPSQLESDWAHVATLISHDSLDDILLNLKKLRPELDSELYLLSLLLYAYSKSGPSGRSSGVQPKKSLKESLIESHLARRWVGEKNLSKHNLYTLLRERVNIFDPEQGDRAELQSALARARQFAAGSNKDMEYAYKCEYLFYERIGYCDTETPLHREIARMERLCNESNYTGAIEAVHDFLAHRDNLVTCGLRKKLNNILLKSHAALFAESRDERHWRKAMALAEPVPDGWVEGLTMMAIVYRNLEQFQQAGDMAKRLLNLSFTDHYRLEDPDHLNELARQKDLDLAIATLAEVTVIDRPHEALCFFQLLLGSRFTDIIPGFEQLQECTRLCRDFEEWNIDPRRRGDKFISATLVTMYRNLRRYGHFKEAILTALYIQRPDISKLIDQSGFFTYENGFRNFLSTLDLHLAFMYYAMGISESARYALLVARPKYDDGVISAIKHLIDYPNNPIEAAGFAGASPYVEYQLILFRYFKLIYITRQIQLSRENFPEDVMTVDYLFRDLWEDTMTLIDTGYPVHQNIFFLAGRLSEFNLEWQHMGAGFLDYVPTRDPDYYYRRGPEEVPDFFSGLLNFHFLEEQVLAKPTPMFRKSRR